MQYSRHGGGCCGVRHLNGMSPFDVNLFKNLLTGQFGLADLPPDKGLIEVILNETQCKEHPWGLKMLEYAGFALVNAFYNSNSGQYCYVFHRADVVRHINTLPFKWTGYVGSEMQKESVSTKSTSRLPSRKDFAKGPRTEIFVEKPRRGVLLRCTVVCTNPKSSYFGKKGVVVRSDWDRLPARFVYTVKDDKNKFFRVDEKDLEVVLDLPAEKQTYS